MFRNWIAHFVHQTQIAGHISGRAVSLRIVMATLMFWTCAAGGFFVAGATTFGLIVLIEIVARPLNRRASQFDKPLGTRTALAIFVVDVGSMFPFMAFGVILSLSDSLPLVLGGFIWTFGVFVHVSNNYGLLPFYNWSQMTVAFGAAGMILWNLMQTPAHGGLQSHWVGTAALLVVYFSNTIGTMTRQNETHRALELARQEANTRLLELEYLSRHDPLTGLLNRRAFDEAVDQMMREQAHRGGVTAFLIDLDGFKPINDSYSHAAGDAVLRAVARRLETLTGRNGVVARLGGDEFGVVRSDIVQSDDARRFGESLIDAVTAPIRYDRKSIQVGASIGIALQGPHPASLPALLSGADQAMFRAKQNPESHVVIYDCARFPKRASLEDRKIITAAMESGEIQPFYQPKICLDTGRIMGFEALSRWRHPTRGLLVPADFLPQINELGLQGEFTLHTARHVLRDLQQITTLGFDPGQMSINIAEATLATVSGHHDLLAVIDTYPHLRRHLTFEITEDIFIARSSDIIQRSISGFRTANVRISLDDFGTGFASFQHLKDLEFDELKLDTGFVRDLGVDRVTHVLVAGLLTMAQGLGVQVVAEGVETPQQRDLLKQLGCLLVQGNLCGAPAPITDILLLLQAERDQPTA